MAMTKAERERVEALETEIALRWPTEAEPQPMTADEIKAEMIETPFADKSIPARMSRAVATGWDFNACSGSVEQKWSDGWYSHGSLSPDGLLWGSSQGMGRLYRSRHDALIAMRWAMCRDMAKKLRGVDREIAKGDDA